MVRCNLNIEGTGLFRNAVPRDKVTDNARFDSAVALGIDFDSVLSEALRIQAIQQFLGKRGAPPSPISNFVVPKTGARRTQQTSFHNSDGDLKRFIPDR